MTDRYRRYPPRWTRDDTVFMAVLVLVVAAIVVVYIFTR